MKILKDKILNVFKKINNIDFDEKEAKLEFLRLPGNSNEIYKVTIKIEGVKFSYDCLFYKHFGRISGNIFS